jgi:hypothetical protein
MVGVKAHGAPPSKRARNAAGSSLQLQSYGIGARQIGIPPSDSFPFQPSYGRILRRRTTHLRGHVETQEHERRSAFVDLELAAVWQGRERGVVTDDEVYQRLDELERLLRRRVFGGLRKVAPGSRAYVGFPAASS